MSNLLNTVKGLMTDGVINNMAGLIGSNASSTKSSLMRLLPGLLGGLIKKGSTESGASSLLGMLKNNNLGGGTLSNLSSLLGGGKATDDFLETGSKLNEGIFGSSLSGISSSSGLQGESSSKLMNAATPLLMGALGKVVKEDNLDAKGLVNYLGSQNAHLSGIAGKVGGQVSEAKSGGGSILKWLIPLFLLLSAAWFFMQHKNESAANASQVNTETTGTEPVATPNKQASSAGTHTHADGTVHEGHHHGAEGHEGHSHGNEIKEAAEVAGNVTGMFVDEAGNLIKDGKILLKKGEFTIKDGEFFNTDGESLGLLKKVGKAIEGAGKAVGGAVGDAGKAVGGAVAGAAEKTADAFKDVFGGMFKKKSSGATVAAYSLSKIVFDKESHKITSFSKNEVMGLAEALKSYPDSKIEVQVNTNDASGDDKENGKLSKIRAEVVHDMLVTLGVADKQISFKGMGTGEDKVAIMIQ